MTFWSRSASATSFSVGRAVMRARMASSARSDSPSSMSVPRIESGGGGAMLFEARSREAERPVRHQIASLAAAWHADRFDGILGFSQGAGAAALLAATLERAAATRQAVHATRVALAKRVETARFAAEAAAERASEAAR